jgi:hypothetical protein
MWARSGLLRGGMSTTALARQQPPTDGLPLLVVVDHGLNHVWSAMSLVVDDDESAGKPALVQLPGHRGEAAQMSRSVSMSPIKCRVVLDAKGSSGGNTRARVANRAGLSLSRLLSSSTRQRRWDTIRRGLVGDDVVELDAADLGGDPAWGDEEGHRVHLSDGVRISSIQRAEGMITSSGVLAVIGPVLPPIICADTVGRGNLPRR